ncbi:MAG: esterase-like activity of phytase family protein, partial [Polyangiaceae bacterium]
MRGVEPIRLELIDDFNPPRPPSAAPPAAAGAAWDAALGGLSGLYYSESERLLYAVTDDPRRFPPRLYTFAVQLSERELEVEPRSVVLLHELKSSSLLTEVDCEALSSDGAQGLLIATEGNDQSAQRESRILQVSKQGLVSGPRVAIPEALLPEAGAASLRGARSNRGFEGIAVSPSGRWLYAILEESLRQDGPDANLEQGADVRLLRWDLHSAAAPIQFFYRTEALSPKPPPGVVARGNNGVSDLVALDDGRLLALERGFVTPDGGAGINTIRLFEVEVPARVTPGDASLPRVSKRLVLDLNDVIPRLEPGLQTLDNFEGMTLGPRLPSGVRSLLLVSDDNFGARQRTVFLAFALRG